MDNLGLAMVVLISGLLIVFVVLILLTGLIWLYGKIISSFSGKGGDTQDKAEKKPEPVAVKKAEPSLKQASVEPNNGIPNEIIAVIAAAVASLEDGAKYTIRGIKRSKPARSAWGNAGVLDNTRPF